MKARLSAFVAAVLGAPTMAHAAQVAELHSVNLLWVRLAAGLVLCTLVAIASVLLLKKFSSRAPMQFLAMSRLGLSSGSSLRVLETRRLSLHADACRFVSADREYLVVVSSGSIAVLRETDAPAPSRMGA